jgi:hypothetical protein
MQFYPRMYGRRGPQAVGQSGPYCCAGPDGCEKIEAVNVACTVGKKHDWRLYQAAPALVQRLGWYAFLEPSVAETQQVAGQ